MIDEKDRSIESKRSHLITARSNGTWEDAVYWRVARILENYPDSRDLPTREFIELYLRVFPQDKTSGAYTEAIPRYRRDIQNVVAPDLYPHSIAWKKRSGKYQSASRSFFSEEVYDERRTEALNYTRNDSEDFVTAPAPNQKKPRHVVWENGAKADRWEDVK